MEALATASASQLPADAPVVPLLRVVTANLMKEPDNEKFRKIKMDGVFPASPLARAKEVSQKSRRAAGARAVLSGRTRGAPARRAPRPRSVPRLCKLLR